MVIVYFSHVVITFSQHVSLVGITNILIGEYLFYLSFSLAFMVKKTNKQQSEKVKLIPNRWDISGGSPFTKCII